MKKLFIAIAMFVFAFAGKVAAQGAGKVSTNDIHFTAATQPPTIKVGEGDVVFSGANMKAGTNSLTKMGSGRLEFTRIGNTVSNVIFKDDAGNTIKLMPEPGSINTITTGRWKIRANTKTKFYRLFGDSDSN